MGTLTISKFAENVCEIMPLIHREYFKRQSDGFYRVKITFPQFVVLDLIYKHQEMNMTDLSRHMKVTTAAITGLVDRLVRESYVEREHDKKDRRIVRIRLTAKGHRIAKNAADDRKKLTEEIFGMISAKERADYLRILNHIIDHIKDIKH